VRLEGLGQMKNPNDLIRIRTRDLPACSVLPQPTDKIWNKMKSEYLKINIFIFKSMSNKPLPYE
jgi:hypothetical protein